jgi:hypothetical protein
MYGGLSQPIFVLGLNQSGANLLCRLLSRHPELSTTRHALGAGRSPRAWVPDDLEIDFSFRLSGLPEKIRPSIYFDCFSHPAYLARYRLTERDLAAEDHERMVAAFRSVMGDSSRRLLQATSLGVIRSRYLQAVLPDATFVGVVRDPYAQVAANARRSNKWGAIEEQAFHWSEGYQQLLADRAALKRFMLVRYEDLVADPLETVEKVCGHCALEFTAKLLDGLRLDQEANDRLIAALDRHDRAVITKLCKRTMQKLGYAPASKDRLAAPSRAVA